MKSSKIRCSRAKTYKVIGARLEENHEMTSTLKNLRRQYLENADR